MFTKKLTVIATLSALAITGCATTKIDPNYAARLTAQASIEQVRAQAELEHARAETARMLALQRIGESGDTNARQFAVFALAFAGNSGRGRDGVVTQPLPPIPDSTGDTALKWAQVLSGPVAMLGSGYFGYKLGVTQSNNNAATTIAGYNSFSSIANSGFNSTTAIANGGFTAAGQIAGNIQAPQPNITIGGNGVIGSGTMSTTLSGTGVLGNGTYTGPVTRNCSGGNGAAGGNGAVGGNGGAGTTAGGAGGLGGAGGAGAAGGVATC